MGGNSTTGVVQNERDGARSWRTIRLRMVIVEREEHWTVKEKLEEERQRDGSERGSYFQLGPPKRSTTTGATEDS